MQTPAHETASRIPAKATIRGHLAPRSAQKGQAVTRSGERGTIEAEYGGVPTTALGSGVLTRAGRSCTCRGGWLDVAEPTTTVPEGLYEFEIRRTRAARAPRSAARGPLAQSARSNANADPNAHSNNRADSNGDGDTDQHAPARTNLNANTRSDSDATPELPLQLSRFLHPTAAAGP
jgi:hypothetical protein